VSPAFPVALALYAVACALYLAHSSTEPDERGARLARTARLALALAFLAHAVDIGFASARGQHPLINTREALSFLSWLTVGAYLATTFRYRLPLVGALLVPVVIVLEVAARLGPARAPSHAETALATIHIGLATAGVAVFAVAAVDAAVYLFAEKQLKRRRFGGLFKKGPPLETLDVLNRRCIVLGFPLYTVAMVTGAMWMTRLPDGGAHRLLQPQYLLATAAWALYAGLLVARVVAGVRGRRAALVTLAGFGAALCVVAFYYLRGPVGA
jgi:ABC-type uncharacterized transport system permease subunit